MHLLGVPGLCFSSAGLCCPECIIALRTRISGCSEAAVKIYANLFRILLGWQADIHQKQDFPAFCKLYGICIDDYSTANIKSPVEVCAL